MSNGNKNKVKDRIHEHTVTRKVSEWWDFQDIWTGYLEHLERG